MNSYTLGDHLENRKIALLACIHAVIKLISRDSKAVQKLSTPFAVATNLTFPSNKKQYNYSSIAVGGTFDQIHRGHRALLERAFSKGEKVYIGLTSDAMVAAAGKKTHNSFEARREQLARFLQQEYPTREYHITKLEETFGPGIFSNDIVAITVSEETLPSVAKANEKRKSLGLPELMLEVVPIVRAENGGKISSTRIRAGEIDLEGRLKK